MKGKRNNTIGIVLIVIGMALLLQNTSHIAFEDTFFIAIGGAFLIGYYFRRNTGYLIAGMVILVLGATSIIDEYRIASVDLSGVLFLVGLGLVFLILYFAKNIRGFIYPGCILPIIGIFSLLDDMYDVEMAWVFFLGIGLAFFLIYLIDTKKDGSKWPIIPGSILIVISALTYLQENKIIPWNFWETLSYIWPVILIVMGIRIIYNYWKSR